MMSLCFCFLKGKFSGVAKAFEMWCMVMLMSACLAATTDLFAQEECATTTIPGLGSESSPFQVASLCQLQAISTVTTAGAYFQLTQDIAAIETRNWNESKGFKPIENFAGTFDGGGYRISNLFIDRPEEDVGLFSNLRGNAVVKDLVLSNASVAGYGAVGGVVGYMEGGLISNVHVMGSSVRGSYEIGGIAGFLGDGKVQKSRAVEIVISGTENSGEAFGGLVGLVQDGGAVSQSYAAGSVFAEGKHDRVGGLVGSVARGGSVRESYALSRVMGRDKVGGLVGSIAGGFVGESYALSQVVGRGSVGGLAGSMGKSGTLRESYALSQVMGNNKVGSLVGGSGDLATVRDSYAAGLINGTDTTTLIGDDVGQLVRSSTRTQSQLQCPVMPGVECLGAVTYSSWDSSGIWYFGSARTLPALRELIDIPATPTDVVLEWRSTNSLGLKSPSPSSASFYELEVEVAGTVMVATAVSPDFEFGDDFLAELRQKNPGGSTISYKVRASSETVTPDLGRVVSYPANGSFRLLNAPGTPTVVQVTPGVNTVRVTVKAPANDGYGRGVKNIAYGSKVDDVDLMSGYIVRVIADDGGAVATETVFTTSTMVAVVLQGLEQNTTYRIEASARNTVVSTGPVVTDEFVTQGGAPGLPNLSPFVWETTQRLVLSWTGPLKGEGEPEITAYRVSIDDGDDGLEARDVGSTTHVVEQDVLKKLRRNFSGGDEIGYSVRAINRNGAGGASTGRFVLLDAPGAPTVRVIPGVHEVRVTVVASANDGYGRNPGDRAYGSQVDGVDLMLAYVIEVIDRNEEVVATQSLNTTAAEIEFAIPGLVSGTEYRLDVFARNAVGSVLAMGPGGAGAAGTSFATDAEPPGIPALLPPVWETTQRLVLSWTEPHQGESEIGEYRVSIDDSGDGFGSFSFGSTMRVIGQDVLEKLRTDFSGGDEIGYSVQAVNGEVAGTPSIGKFVLLDVPGTPTVRVIPGWTTVQVTIQVPNNDGYGRATETSTYGSSVNNIPLGLGYRVQLYSDGEAVQGPRDIDLEGSIQSTVVVFSGLVVHSIHTVTVTARNVVGNGGRVENEFSTGPAKNTAPMIVEFAGRTVLETDMLTISVPRSFGESTIRAVAQDEFREPLKWTISDISSGAMAHFVVDGDAEDTGSIKGTTEVVVRYVPGNLDVDRFVIKLRDGFGASDQLIVRVMKEDLPTKPVIVYRKDRAEIQFLDLPPESTQIEGVRLDTLKPQLGLVWSIEVEVPLSVRAVFVGDPNEIGRAVNLLIPIEESFGIFMIRAAIAGYPDLYDEVAMWVLREDSSPSATPITPITSAVERLRLRVFLGGVIR